MRGILGGEDGADDIVLGDIYESTERDNVLSDWELISATPIAHGSIVVEEVPVYLTRPYDTEPASVPFYMLLSETVLDFRNKAAADRTGKGWTGDGGIDEIHLTHNEEEVADEDVIALHYAKDIDAGNDKTVFDMKRRIWV